MYANIEVCPRWPLNCKKVREKHVQYATLCKTKGYIHVHRCQYMHQLSLQRTGGSSDCLRGGEQDGRESGAGGGGAPSHGPLEMGDHEFHTMCTYSFFQKSSFLGGTIFRPKGFKVSLLSEVLLFTQFKRPRDPDVGFRDRFFHSSSIRQCSPVRQ